MSRIKGGVSGAYLDSDAVTAAIKMSPRPRPVAAYRCSTTTGTNTGLTSTGIYLEFQWQSSTHVAVLTRLKFGAVCTSFSSTQVFGFLATRVVRIDGNPAFGTALTLTGLEQRTSYGASQVTRITRVNAGAGSGINPTNQDAAPPILAMGPSRWQALGVSRYREQVWLPGADELLVLTRGEGIQIGGDNANSLTTAGLDCLFEIDWLELPIAEL
jgi:hypothetical protein